MGNEDRQQIIRDLKALRAELMAYKELQEGESGDGNVGIVALRKDYMVDAGRENMQMVKDYGAVSEEVYSQYIQDEEKSDSQQEEQKVLARRR